MRFTRVKSKVCGNALNINAIAGHVLNWREKILDII